MIVLTASDNVELLIRRVIDRSLPEGAVFLKAKDLSVLDYIQQLPAEEFHANRAVIQSSPAILDKLLHAVFARFDDEADWFPEQRAAAREACSRFSRELLYSVLRRAQG